MAVSSTLCVFRSVPTCYIQTCLLRIPSLVSTTQWLQQPIQSITALTKKTIQPQNHPPYLHHVLIYQTMKLQIVLMATVFSQTNLPNLQNPLSARSLISRPPLQRSGNGLKSDTAVKTSLPSLSRRSVDSSLSEAARMVTTAPTFTTRPHDASMSLADSNFRIDGSNAIVKLVPLIMILLNFHVPTYTVSDPVVLKTAHFLIKQTCPRKNPKFNFPEFSGIFWSPKNQRSGKTTFLNLWTSEIF